RRPPRARWVSAAGSSSCSAIGRKSHVGADRLVRAEVRAIRRVSKNVGVWRTDEPDEVQLKSNRGTPGGSSCGRRTVGEARSVLERATGGAHGGRYRAELQFRRVGGSRARSVGSRRASGGDCLARAASGGP